MPSQLVKWIFWGPFLTWLCRRPLTPQNSLFSGRHHPCTYSWLSSCLYSWPFFICPWPSSLHELRATFSFIPHNLVDSIHNELESVHLVLISLFGSKSPKSVVWSPWLFLGFFTGFQPWTHVPLHYLHAVNTR